MEEASEIKPNSKQSRRFGLKRGSRVYIVEFLLMHIALAGVLAAAINLFNELLDHTKSSEGGLDIYQLAGVDYTLFVVAYGLVSTALFVLLYSRVRRTERSNPDIGESRRRRWIPYLFLSIAGLTVISYTIGVVYSILLELFSGTETGEQLWRSLVKQLFAIALICLVSLLVARGVDPDGRSDNE